MQDRDTKEAFRVLPDPAELLNEDEMAERFISAVNISTLEPAGGVLGGYGDLPGAPDLSRESSAVTRERLPPLTKEMLASRWGIGLDTAYRTLKVTTQRGIRKFVHPSDRRVSTRKPHLVFPTMRNKMYTDTMFAKSESIRKYICAQTWTDGRGYSLFYPSDGGGD